MMYHLPIHPQRPAPTPLRGLGVMVQERRTNCAAERGMMLGMAHIGKPERVITIEPLEIPEPSKVPEEPDYDPAPEPTPVPEQEPVPA